jgi:feruloyl-CoA synthase
MSGRERAGADRQRQGKEQEMSAAVRYRPIRFGVAGRGSVEVIARPDGSRIVRARQPLGAYPRSMSERLVFWAQTAPERTFIAKRDASGEWRRISYAQAADAARRIGQALLDRGLSAERPVLILSDNDLEHALLVLAGQYVGVPTCALSPAYSLVSQDHERLRHCANTLTPGLVFAADGARYAKAINAAFDGSVEALVTANPVPDRRSTLFADLLATQPTAAVDAAFDAVGPDTIAKFLFTSGSTKLPKAVVNTQRMLTSNQQMIAQCLPFIADEPPVLVDWLPWNHTFGGNHNVGITLFHGGTLYIDDGKPTPQGIAHTLRNLREISPTVYFNVPKGFEEIAHAMKDDAQLRKSLFARARMFFYAGAGLAQPVWDALHSLAEAEIGERIVIITGLGMTETAPFAMCVNHENVRAGDLGVPAPGVELKLVEIDGKLEVRYRGPSVMPGYWRAPEANREAFDEEGFFCSGDAVRFADERDPDRGFVFDGRIAEDFKLATGTWVSVGPLRARVIAAADPYVQDVVVTGINRDDVGLLVFPHLPSCRKLAGAAEATPAAQVLAHAQVRSYFTELLTRLAREATGSANRVTRALLLAEPASIDRGEITDKGSINQRAVLKHRADDVERLYADTDPAILRPAK